MSEVPTQAELASMEEDELLLCLGRETAGNAAVPQSLGSLIQRGQVVFAEVQPRLRTLLCDADGPKAVLTELSKDALHGAVVAIIAGTAGLALTQAAIIYLAAIVVRRGLEYYCATPVAGAAKPASAIDRTAS
jgi:hypothetical protein